MNEPGGLSAAEGLLYVADTNNHRVMSFDLTTKQATVLPITGLTRPDSTRPRSAPDSSDAIAVESQNLAVSEKLAFSVTLSIPEQHKLNSLAPITWEIFAEGEQQIIPTDALGVRDEATADDQHVARFELPLTGQPGAASLIVRMSFGYCGAEENALCRLATAAWKIPVQLNTDGGTSEISLVFPKP